MRKQAAILAMTLAFTVAPAHADTIDNFYNNTVVVTYPSGATVRYRFDPDNTFSATLPDGATAQGTYTINGTQHCLTRSSGETQCVAYIPGKNVGDTWTQPSADGSATVSVTIEAGR